MGEIKDSHLLTKCLKCYNYLGNNKKRVIKEKDLFKTASASYTWMDYGLDDGHVSAKLGSAETHASASAGMYKMGKNGERFWSPGIKVAVGASASVFEGEAPTSKAFAVGRRGSPVMPGILCGIDVILK